MKNLVALFCAVSAFAAFAADSEIVFGALRVDSTAEQTIVSIPWAEAGTGDAVKVKDAIKTANLTKGDENGDGGDQLYLYSGGSYKLWQLNSAGIWKGASVVKSGADDKTTFEATAGEEETLSRGDALILIRKDPTKPFYLYGQYKSVAGVKTTLPANAFSLIAPPKTEADEDGTIKLSAATWENITSSDHIILPSGLQLDFENGAWGKRTYKDQTDRVGTWSEADAKVPMGQGVWFRAGAGDGKSVEW